MSISRDYLCMACGKIHAEYDPSGNWRGTKNPSCSCGHRTIRIIAQEGDESDFAAAQRIREHLPRIKQLHVYRDSLLADYRKLYAQLEQINEEIKTIAEEDAEIGRELDTIQAEIHAAEGKE